jgi:hypothetical protein
MSIRLSAEEREQINTLAHHLHFRPSPMVRHFVLQAVAFYANQVMEKGEMGGRS